MPNYVLDSSAASVNSAINKVVNITDQPTAGSNNVVKSGGVKTYVDNSVASVQTDVNGITKTVNGVTTTKAVVFTKSFTGTIPMPADSVTGSAAHGLGAQPFIFLGYLKCKVANNGYSVGDLVNISARDNHHPGVWADATNIYVRSSHDFYIVDADGNDQVRATPANFDIELRGIL